MELVNTQHPKMSHAHPKHMYRTQTLWIQLWSGQRLPFFGLPLTPFSSFQGSRPGFVDGLVTSKPLDCSHFHRCPTSALRSAVATEVSILSSSGLIHNLNRLIVKIAPLYLGRDDHSLTRKGADGLAIPRVGFVDVDRQLT